MRHHYYVEKSLGMYFKNFSLGFAIKSFVTFLFQLSGFESHCLKNEVIVLNDLWRFFNTNSQGTWKQWDWTLKLLSQIFIREKKSLGLQLWLKDLNLSDEI